MKKFSLSDLLKKDAQHGGGRQKLVQLVSRRQKLHLLPS